jgi:hypothetical protein
MWIFAKMGFLSVVEHSDDPNKLMIRARFQEDIEELCKRIRGLDGSQEVAWQETPEGDYRYRVTCGREIIAKLVQQLVREIDYTNFKQSVHGSPARDRAYMACWSALHHAQQQTLS